VIAKGTSEEEQARRRIAYWETMIRHWNIDADNFRRAARGLGWVTSDLVDEAERTRGAVREAIVRADQVTDDLPPGHELRTQAIRVTTALAALSESLAISIEELAPLAAGGDRARLKYLVTHDHA
jgi:hypothetical protein